MSGACGRVSSPAGAQIGLSTVMRGIKKDSLSSSAATLFYEVIVKSLIRKFYRICSTLRVSVGLIWLRIL